MADPSKKRVVCPVDDCEDKFVADTNKKSHYTNVHFSKDPSLPRYRPSLFAEMSDADHGEYTSRTGIVLHASPDFQRPPTTSALDSIRELDIPPNDAIILMLEAIIKRRGGDLHDLFLEYASNRALANPPPAPEQPADVQPAANDDDDDDVEEAPPRPKKAKTTKKTAKQRAALVKSNRLALQKSTDI